MPLANLIIVISLLAISASAQTVQFHDVKGRKGVQESYDKFKDLTIVSTKKVFTEAVPGKSFLGIKQKELVDLVIAMAFQGKQINGEPKAVTLAIIQGGILRDKSLYFAPGTELIAIADGERIPIGTVDSSGRLTVTGEYSNSVYISTSIEAVRKLAAAKKVEMAIGTVELKIVQRHQDHWQNLVAELDARQAQSASTGKK